MLVLALASLLSSYVDFDKKEINLKVIYVGTTDALAHANLEYVYSKTNPDSKGQLVSSSRSRAGRRRTSIFSRSRWARSAGSRSAFTCTRRSPRRGTSRPGG